MTVGSPHCPAAARRLVEGLPGARIEVWDEVDHLPGHWMEGDPPDQLLARRRDVVRPGALRPGNGR